eukprot:scaffold75397_cov44-Phaeocystis_antarctica.AAC.2
MLDGRLDRVASSRSRSVTLSRLSAHSLALKKLKYPHFETMWAPDKLHSAAPCVERKKKIKMMIG